MAEAKAWSVIGMLGGLYGLLSGIAILFAGQQAAQTINTLYWLPIVVQTYAPTAWASLLTLLAYISPSLTAFSVGPLAALFGFQAAGFSTIFGIVVIIHGLLILIGGYMAWVGNKWGAALMAIIGFIGFLVFNLGGLLGLVAGIVLWYEM
ncbi:MAG: hypothetical protein ACETWM_15960 [Candidatus Lokiarchaeia archaeon]